jgi:biopolymer transport protein ExbD
MEVLMQKSAPVDPGLPILEMNTTPLIDVLLVLLVMFIITIPIQTHAVKLDLPSDRPPLVVPPNPVVNTIETTKAGAVLWDGRPVSNVELRQELRVTQQMSPVPELHLRPHPETRYEVVDGVLATIKREQVRNFGFVGNERYLNR